MQSFEWQPFAPTGQPFAPQGQPFAPTASQLTSSVYAHHEPHLNVVNALQPQQHYQQKRRQDEDDCIPVKRARAAPAMPPQPSPHFVVPPAQPGPLHSIFAQPLRHPDGAMEDEDTELEDASCAPISKVVVCDTRACPPCFAHRFCRPNQHCLVAAERSDAMQMEL